MNRKGMREQNDISIIIGNLPKRLQEKIITREGNNNSSSSNIAGRDNGGVSSGCTGNININDGKRRTNGIDSLEVKPTDTLARSSNGNELTSIDFFLRMSAKKETDDTKVENIVKPVLEASGSLTKSIQKEKKCESQTNAIIPGIIRLNAENARRISVGNQDSKNVFRKHDRHNRHQTRQELLSARYELPVSPVRHVQKLQLPKWLESLDDPIAQRLPPLFETLQNAMSHNVIIEVWCNNLKILQTIKIFLI